ncbi:MAG: hypothetical protein EOP61_33685, partial [Sphingomonadales bacterium]
MAKPVGKGAIVALAAVALAIGTIGWRLVYDPTPPAAAAAGTTDALSALEADSASVVPAAAAAGGVGSYTSRQAIVPIASATAA